MTINRAMQLEEVNNELIQVLLGLTARVRTAVKMLKECDHDHTNITTTLLSTFQAESLLKKVAPTAEEVLLKKGAAFEGFADAARSELQGEKEAAAEPFLMRHAEPVDFSLPEYEFLKQYTDYPLIQEELDAHGNWVDKKCQNPHCEDGLAPRKTGPDDDDVDMEPCPVCGGPNGN